MNRKRQVGWIVVGLAGLGLVATLRGPVAQAQRNRGEAAWEYKVVAFSYNPGESLSDERRAAVYERTLTDQGRQGWEPVGSLLSRDAVQTVGGGVTTRETTSFVAFRRPR